MQREVPFGSGVLESASLAFCGVEVGPSDWRERVRLGAALRYGPVVWPEDPPLPGTRGLAPQGVEARRLLIEGIEPAHLLAVDVFDIRHLVLRFGPMTGLARSTAGDMLRAMGWMEGLDALALDIQGLGIPLARLHVALWVDAVGVHPSQVHVTVRLGA